LAAEASRYWSGRDVGIPSQRLENPRTTGEAPVHVRHVGRVPSRGLRALAGVDPAVLGGGLQTSNPVTGLFGTFTGGAFNNFSVFSLGIMPYITAAIVMQLMTVAIPRLQELAKEGETGQQKITQYTRYFTLALAL